MINRMADHTTTVFYRTTAPFHYLECIPWKFDGSGLSRPSRLRNFSFRTAWVTSINICSSVLAGFDFEKYKFKSVYDQKIVSLRT